MYQFFKCKIKSKMSSIW